VTQTMLGTKLREKAQVEDVNSLHHVLYHG